jgi:hypothetical protein
MVRQRIAGCIHMFATIVAGVILVNIIAGCIHRFATIIAGCIHRFITIVIAGCIQG